MPSSAPQRYQYRPIRGEHSIRVLTLLPGHDARDELHCRLDEIELPDAVGSYQALSYAWGNANEQATIHCDDEAISITVSLAGALRALRDPLRPRRIWADAICINQDDDAEKAQQVGLMADIYRCASQVVVWLGDDAQGTAKACFDLIQVANCHLYGLWNEYRGDLEAIPFIDVAAIPASGGPSVWKIISHLLHLPWFTRVWVVQEVAVARDCVLVWGGQQMDIAQLAHLIVWMEYRAELRLACGLDMLKYAAVVAFGYFTYTSEGTWKAGLPFLEIFRERYIAPHEWSLLHVLHAGRLLRATHGIDHVYAFLGNPLARIAKDLDGGGDDRDDHDDSPATLIIQPDYTKPPAKVFYEVACALLRSTRDAAYLLSFVNHSFERDIQGRESPSWVPRWDNDMWHIAHSPTYWYRAGGSGANFRAHNLGNKLVLPAARVFDRLSWTSEAIQWESLAVHHHRESRDYDAGHDSSASGGTYLDSLWDAIRQHIGSTTLVLTTAHHLQPDAELEDAFLLTLARGFCEEAGLPTGSRLSKCRESYHAFRHVLHRQQAHDPLQDTQISTTHASCCTQEVRNQAHQYFHEISFGYNQKLATTLSGRLCLVPRFSRPGDVCCIVSGSSMPVVLRPGTGDQDTFSLVGAAYIHGVMGGELARDVMEDVMVDDLYWKEIEII